jgi:hypothetical protein
MANSTGVVLAAGAITLLNEAVFTPIESGGKISANFNWRIIPATAGLAFALAGLEKLAPQFAVGLAWFTLVGALVFRVGNAPTPIENANRILGFTGGKK